MTCPNLIHGKRKWETMMIYLMHIISNNGSTDDLGEITQFLEGKDLEELLDKKKKVLAMKSRTIQLMNEYLYKIGPDDFLRWCVLEHEE